MASNVNISSSGYDVQVVGDFLQQLNCGICMMIIKNAMNGCSKHVFCESCIKKQVQSGVKIDGNVTCPGGCGKIIDPSKLETNGFVDRMVNCLTTKCSNNDCNWQGDLLDLIQVHQTNCEYILQLCVNNGCNETYLMKDVLKHKEDCLFKLIECTYCQRAIPKIHTEAHVVECLNEQVECIYYNIGCKNKLCRRDICSHEETYQVKHMRLIYQDSLTSKNEVIFLKEENTEMKGESALMKQEQIVMKEENTVVKGENKTLKDKLKQLETKSDEAVTQLKLEVKVIRTNLRELKQENLKLIGKKRKLDIDASNGIVVAKNEVVVIKLNKEVNNIDLNHRLSMVSSLHGEISLVNDDKVMMFKGNNSMRLYADDISKCYKENDFKYLLEKFELKDRQSLIIELLNKASYQLYDYNSSTGKQRYILVFPLDLQNIKDVEISITGLFKVKILNNEFSVEILHERIMTCFIRIEKYRKQLKLAEKFDLQQIYESRIFESIFAHGYAFLLFK